MGILAWIALTGLAITIGTALIHAAVRFQRVSGDVEKNRQAIDYNATATREAIADIHRRMEILNANMETMENRIMNVLSHIAKRVDGRG